MEYHSIDVIGGSSVKNSYNTGNIVNSDTEGGTLSAISNKTIENCFYLYGTAAAASASEADSEGKGKSVTDLATMKTKMNEYFKTQDAWEEAQEGVNDGYPTLKGMPNN